MRLHNKIGGFYKIEAIKIIDKVEVSRRIVADWFPNLITNQGLDAIATRSDILRYCQVGTGSTTPTITDTGLVSVIASKDGGASNENLQSVTQNINSTSPYYRYARRTFRFAEGTATGNLSEVGVGWGTSNQLFSRALILDVLGNPTTITILSDETLDVTYEFRLYPDETDSTGTTVFTGNIGGTYDWIVRLATATVLNTIVGMTQYFPRQFNAIYTSANSSGGPETSYQDIGIITSKPLNGVSGGIVNTVTSYVSGNYYLLFTLTAGLNLSNYAGGLRSMYLVVGATGLQLQFDPAIPKTSKDIVAITLKVSWGRV